MCQETDEDYCYRVEGEFLARELHELIANEKNIRDNAVKYENLINTYEFCKRLDLRCIYSAEAYYVDNRCEQDRGNYHLILVAKNINGYKDINRIISEANKTGYYYKPRIDLELLLSVDPKNVIVTTACVGSRLFKSDDYEEEFLIPIHNHFKNNFYLEVQNHNDDYQKSWNEKILELSSRYKIDIIHANDSHYIKQEDSKYRQLFLKAKGIIYEEETGFILDYPNYNEIIHRYIKQGVLNEEQARKSLENTLVFDECEDLGFNKEFKIPKVTEGDSNNLLKQILNDSWKNESINVKEDRKKEYLTAIRDEMDTVAECNMADYFILDHLIVKRAVEKYNAVLTRSGRGSAVSFYINKLLGLTEVDRLKAPVTLYPSRFMTAQRILDSRSLPD